MAMFPELRASNDNFKITTSTLALNSHLVGDMMKNISFTVENILGGKESVGADNSFPANDNREPVALAA